MDKQQVEQRTEEFFRGGLHCAEAVLAAVLESQGVSGAEFSPRAASAFGGGVGRSKKELCGALSGGLIALGIIQGRDIPDESWDAVAATAEGLRSRFETCYGSTTCGPVLERLGPQERMDKCVRLAANTAGLVFTALAGDQDSPPAQACGCGCADLHAKPAPAKTGCGCK